MGPGKRIGAEDFSKIIKKANVQREKDDPDQEWGDLLYYKGHKDDEKDSVQGLFKTIVSVAEKQPFNTIQHRHADVFDLVGVGKLIDSNDSYEYILEMFSALYFPNNPVKNHSANDLRQVLEDFFMAANKWGILDDEYVNGWVSLKPSCLFMSLGSKCDVSTMRDPRDPNRKFTKIYSEKIFPSVIGNEMNALLSYTQTFSHRGKKSKTPQYRTKEESFGHFFLLCHVIRWLGEYVKANPDPNINKAKITNWVGQTLVNNTPIATPVTP